eukprot:1755122-Pyramimonas_sp.AAC.1
MEAKRNFLISNPQHLQLLSVKARYLHSLMKEVRYVFTTHDSNVKQLEVITGAARRIRSQGPSDDRR